MLKSEAGGVVHFSGGAFSKSISDNINFYAPPDAAMNGDLTITEYGVLDGEVTTDASGNITAWILEYTLRDFNGQVWVGPNRPADFMVGAPENVKIKISFLSLATLNTIPPNNVLLDRAPINNAFSFTSYDVALIDAGQARNEYFATDAGNLTRIAEVPEPHTLALFLAALLVLLPKSNLLRRRRK